jgi:hypothetical protein
MTSVVRGVAWLGIFLGICVAPLVFALMATDQPGQGFWTDFSVGLGFVGLSLMGLSLPSWLGSRPSRSRSARTG